MVPKLETLYVRCFSRYRGSVEASGECGAVAHELKGVAASRVPPIDVTITFSL